jgi:ribosomal protein S18 acetylase RimI-like enzyme
MLEIIHSPLDDLEEYERISIGHWVVSHLDRRALLESSLVEYPVNPYYKDYDLHEEAKPSETAKQFDTRNWGMLSAFRGGKRIGGAILAWDSPGFDMLAGRIDLAVMTDLRVDAEERGSGIGREIFGHALAWASERGCSELRVETQETNVPACRFYSAMGCRLISIEEGAYGPDIDELKLIWSCSTLI